MKKIIPVVASLLIVNISFGQMKDTVQPGTKESYLLKSKNQRTAGWILTAGGSALMVTGVSLLSANILVTNPNSQEVKNRETAGLILLSAGTVALAGGIINLIAAKRNGKRAMAIRIKQLNTGIQHNKTMLKISYPAVSFRLVL